MSGHALLATYGNPLRICDSAQFDGTNDFQTRGADLSGNADSKTGILSVWYRVDGGAGTPRVILQGATTVGGALAHFRLRQENTGTLNLIGTNAAGSTILSLFTTSQPAPGAAWIHLLFSWDLLNGVGQVFVNDVQEIIGSTLTNDTIDYTNADWAVGAQANGANKLNGCLAELFFVPGQFLDFSIVANRRRFISVGGKPVHLGANGSLALGVTPAVYLHLDDAESAANFATNRGGGGNFTITGALTTGSTSPSD